VGSAHELDMLVAVMVLSSSASASIAERREGEIEGEASGGSHGGLDPLDLTGGPTDSIRTPRRAHAVAMT
jgi:hypothetical protein